MLSNNESYVKRWNSQNWSRRAFIAREISLDEQQGKKFLSEFVDLAEKSSSLTGYTEFMGERSIKTTCFFISLSEYILSPTSVETFHQ